MEAEEFWQGEDGDAYHRRNWVDWQLRVPFFKRVLELTGARSVLEFGCGPGWNLSACKRAFPDTQLYGHEINYAAEEAARAAGLNVRNWRSSIYALPETELVFTAGCLIHIPPDEINTIMGRLVAMSYKYVMCIEYEDEEETEIEYRGKSGLLWKRPYIEMYKDMGLKLIETGKLQQDVGFDNCTYGLFTK